MPTAAPPAARTRLLTCAGPTAQIEHDLTPRDRTDRRVEEGSIEVVVLQFARELRLVLTREGLVGVLYRSGIESHRWIVDPWAVPRGWRSPGHALEPGSGAGDCYVSVAVVRVTTSGLVTTPPKSSRTKVSMASSRPRRADSSIICVLE